MQAADTVAPFDDDAADMELHIKRQRRKLTIRKKTDPGMECQPLASGDVDMAQPSGQQGNAADAQVTQQPLTSAVASPQDMQQPMPSAEAPSQDMQRPMTSAEAPSQDMQRPMPSAGAPSQDIQACLEEAAAGTEQGEHSGGQDVSPGVVPPSDDEAEVGTCNSLLGSPVCYQASR